MVPVLNGAAVGLGEAFVLGGNVFGWTATEDESVAVLDAYVEGGGRTIDTADAYSAWVPGHRGGESEEIIGRWLAARGHRDSLMIATKVGQHPGAPGLSRASIRAGIEGSLRRLRTDRVDLYFAHFDDPDTPLEETVAALDELVREGKVRHLAASNYAPDRLVRAFDVAADGGLAGFVAFQAHYNLVRRSAFETRYRDLLAARGLAVLTYYSLAQGFLTGKYRDGGSDGTGPRVAPAVRYLDDRGRRVLAVLDRLAAGHGVPPAAVALAWLSAQPVVTAPTVSARTPAQLAEISACRGLRLDPAELAALDEASS